MTDAVGQVQDFEDIIPLEPEPEVHHQSHAPIDPSIPPPSAKSKIRMLEEMQEVEYRAYHVPLILLALGLGSALIITPLAAAFGPMATERPWTELGVYSLVYVAGVGLGLLLIEVCSAFGIVTEAPWKLTSLRIAATFAVTDTIAIIFALLLRTPFIPEGFALIAFYFLIRWLEDLEAQDGAIVTLTLFLPKFFIGLWLAMQFGLIG
ncbi:MAG: hypothetical protein H6810_05845 [Phycisphaeraceae bacterium]|nr:MAG: hypothetical protein H6810_05845 [Phycisphaeraceae bacterium]